MSAFVYNMTIIMFGSYILVPVIVLSVVGTAWLIGRAGERIGLLRASRPQGSGGDRDGEQLGDVQHTNER